MSTTRSKKEIVRLAWLVELRRQGHRQLVGGTCDGRGRVCALQFLWEVAGAPMDVRNFRKIGALADLGSEMTLKVMHMNDGIAPYRRHTFSEIADEVASWFGEPRGSSTHANWAQKPSVKAQLTLAVDVDLEERVSVPPADIYI